MQEQDFVVLADYEQTLAALPGQVAGLGSCTYQCHVTGSIPMSVSVDEHD